MKKHILGILILILVLSIIGVGIWFFIKKNNLKTLYKVRCEFVLNNDEEILLSNITQAESLYQSKVLPTENRLTVLHTVISKIDSFEKDLTSYLMLSNDTNSTTNKLTKTYKDLSSSRKALIDDYNEYIVRMQGNTNIDGNSIQNLYNEIFTKTNDFVYKYNDCFNATFSYTFNKVYKVSTIKSQLYSLYSATVNNLLNNISNYSFRSTALINRLNGGIYLDNNNLHIKESVEGGEFSLPSQNFKKHFNSCNLESLVTNFETYYSTVYSINPSTETSNEKLAVYYAKQILEI